MAHGRSGLRRPAWFSRLTGGRLLLALLGAALLIGLLSLLIPSTPSYDPWSWLIWGREIIHLDLHTDGGPSWKPLPVLFTTVFAVFGSAAPDLWLVVARAGAILAVAMSVKLAWRATRMLTGDQHAVPAALAAVIAGGSLAVGAGFISDNALGYSEGLMTALVLLAIDRHLDGDMRGAFAFGLGAALDRPEIWAFWGLYGLWLGWRDREARKLVVALFAVIPLLWFLPELWGSGQLFRGVSRAQHVRSNSAARTAFPFWTELSKHAWKHVLLRVKVPALVAMVTAAALLWRARGALAVRPGTTTAGTSNRLSGALAVLLIGGLGIAWWVLIAVMTQVGFSGNDRYLILGAGLISVAGGIGWGWGAYGLGRLFTRIPAVGRQSATGQLSASALSAAGATACVVLFMTLSPWIGASIVDVPATHRALVYQAKLRTGLATAIHRAGGAKGILNCGTVMTEGFQVPLLAWTLKVRSVRVVATPLKGEPIGPPPNTIFQNRAQHKASLLPSFPMIRAWSAAGARYQQVAHTSTFRVFSTCKLR